MMLRKMNMWYRLKIGMSKVFLIYYWYMQINYWKKNVVNRVDDLY